MADPPEELPVTIAQLVQVMQVANQGFQDSISKALVKSSKPKPKDVDPGKLTEVDGVKWTTFRANFLRVKAINAWDNTYALSRLPICFEGPAARAVEHVDVSSATLLHDLIDLYDTIFINPASTKLFRVQFDQLSRHQGEDLLAYHTRLREVYIKAYPQDKKLEQSEKLKDRFCLHLGSMSLSKTLNSLESYDKLTYTELLTRAQSLGASDLLCRTAYAKKAVNAMDFQGTEAEALAMGDEGAIAAMNFPSTPGDHRGLTCHHCSRTGHIAPSCPDIQKAMERVRRNPEGYGFPANFRLPPTSSPAVSANMGRAIGSTPSRGQSRGRSRGRGRARGRGRGRGGTSRVNAMEETTATEEQEDPGEDYYPLPEDEASGN